MKTSVIKASRESSEALWRKLEALNIKIGSPRFERFDAQGGFYVMCPRVENGKFVYSSDGSLCKKEIFRYQNYEGMQRIWWDESALTV